MVKLRIMENKSREDINLSPVSKIEIYSFFDPFSSDCSNYQQVYPN